MNLTIQIMAITPSHDLSYDTAKDARRLRQGDFVDVWDADVVAPFNGTDHIMREPIVNPRFVFIHVRNVPAQVTLERAKNRLITEDSDFADIIVGGRSVPNGVLRRKSKWGAVLSSIPTAVRNRLQTDRQITVSWTQVKNYVKNVRSNINLTDADV